MKFLCPDCKYGFLARVIKSAEGIPYDSEYFCLDETKKREYDLPKGYTFENNVPSLLDFDNGPGGWDGKTCINFVQRDAPQFETGRLTTNG